MKPDPAIQKLKDSSTKIELTFSKIELEAVHFIFQCCEQNYANSELIEISIFYSSRDEVREVREILDAAIETMPSKQSIKLNYNQWITYQSVIAYPLLDRLPLKQEWRELDIIDLYWEPLNIQQTFWDEKLKQIREEMVEG